MNKKELSQLYFLNREIAHDYQRLAELEAAAVSATSVIGGLPHAGKLSDKTAIAAEIADLHASIAIKTERTVREYKRLDGYIQSIPDSRMRIMLTLRYINGLPWNQVAESMGGGNTPQGLLMAQKRFLENNESR
ncbi:hypothetical protein FACS1894208_01340 [Clostridia bacterium]|nr:hypothetical protein FACS1894208_01340 [Clostridia bacterium]